MLDSLFTITLKAWWRMNRLSFWVPGVEHRLFGVRKKINNKKKPKTLKGW